jgi:hypothetical protein
MLPDIVTFWHGRLDRLRRTCLRSQVAAGHKVTVYSFDPIPGLPGEVGNAEAEAILPQAFAERLRPAEPDGSWRDWTLLQFSDFFRMRLMAMRAGLWCDADLLLLKAIELDPAKPCFAWEGSRQLGNSVLYLPADDPIVTAYTRLMASDDLEPDWLPLRYRARLALRRLTGRSARAPDLRVAIFGPASLTALARRHDKLQYALPRRSFYAVHAAPKRFFEPSDFSALITDPAVTGLHISPKGRGNEAPVAGSLHAWASECFGG